MAGVNKVILIGRLGADPEVRYTSDGRAVANFRIATSMNYTGKNGEKTEKTDWHRIVAFGKLGEICGEYLSKGKQVYIEGRIQTRSWDDREGAKKWTTEIVATTMQMLGGAGPGSSASGDTELTPAQDEPGPSSPLDDDIPF